MTLISTPEIFTIEEIHDAYRRWKHFIYHDKSYLFYRKQCAEFECGEFGNEIEAPSLNEKFQKLLDCLNQPEPDISEWLKRIRPYPIPKKIKRIKEEIPLSENEKRQPECVKKKDEIAIVHNTQPSEIIYEKVTWLIDAPVEIHIISVLWVLKIGKNLQEGYKNCNYGNELVENLDGNGLSLFTPYHFNYQKWRDNAIKKAQSLVEEKEDVLIIGLDVKEYYHSIRLTKSAYLESADEKITKKDKKLSEILFKVSAQYFEHSIFENTWRKNRRKEYGLPIGLVSSAILANDYLKNFDLKVLEEIHPSFYGRYVDDILIVLKADIKCNNVAEIKKLADKYLNLVLDPHNDACERPLKEVKNLKIQHEKVVLYYFDADEPSTMLDKFMQEIKERSSEFRLLPTEEDERMDFHEAAFSIHYDDSIMKLRSVKDFTTDRFGVSSYLAKMIYGALTVSKLFKPEIARQIHSFFQGGRAIEFSILWEKAATYFVVTKNKNGLSKFETNIKSAIEKIQIDEGAPFDAQSLKDTLTLHWEVAKSMALALHPELLDSINGLTKILRKSNLIRHSYVAYPLVNYLELGEKENWSYLDFKWEELSHDSKPIESVFRKASWSFSPRFVHFHEIALIWVDRCLSKPRKQYDEVMIMDKYLNEVFKIYHGLNYGRFTPDLSSLVDDSFLDLRKQFFDFPESAKFSGDKYEVTTLNIASHENLDKPKIAIANLEVKAENIEASYLQSPNLTRKRRDDFYSILNQITEHGGADLLVLPEACVPYRWVSLLCEKVKGQNMAMVFGLEHWIKRDYAYNFLVTLIPVKVKGKKDNNGEYKNGFDGVIPIFRLKNHYSPAEIEELTGYRYEIPKQKTATYHLVNWRGLKFTTFNCFELADISHRAAFRSKLDILVACEYNPDINYYSNIAESTSRDLHCFFVQANNSKFGDSRITQPVKTENKDILRIKGGENPTVLIEKIRVDLLRKFQFKEWSLQLQDKSFKPTPPGFDPYEVGKRLKIKCSKSKPDDAI